MGTQLSFAFIRLLGFLADLPQLDTCTPDSSFGILLPILSKNSRQIFDALRALSCCQLSLLLPLKDAEILQSPEATRNAMAAIGSDIYSNSEETIAACVLLTVCEVMPQITADWHRGLKERVAALSSLNIHGFLPGHRGSASWVVLRLGLFAFKFSPYLIQSDLAINIKIS